MAIMKRLFGIKKSKIASKPTPKPKSKPKAKITHKTAPKAKIVHKKPSIPSVKVEVKQAAPILEGIPDDKAFEMLKTSHVPVVPFFSIKKESDIKEALKKVGTPAILKVYGAKIANRTEVGGVVSVSSEAEATEAFKKLMKIKGAEKVIAQKVLTGIEMILGTKSDQQFGTIVSVGLGGAYKEIIKDVAFRVVPFSDSDAEAMLKELKGFEVIASAGNKINVQSLKDNLVKLGKFAVENKQIKSSTILFFCNSDGCWASDVVLSK
ncbi:MAG: acetate--CoA ligase family protein [Candidatus Aenigmarchaeota archaeon]|nr:acetate--CoA ligase family protein [Candidatus Aenigmarchaeota archaeon]